MVKNKKQFCGLSNEEKRLIKEKKDDIKLDFSIKCFGYADAYDVCWEDGLVPVLDALEEHLPFIKEQKETILEMYEENGYKIHDTELEDFVNDIYNIVGDTTIDVEKINPEIFERAKALENDNVDYNVFVHELYDDFIDMLSQKGTTEEKIEIMKMYSQK